MKAVLFCGDYCVIRHHAKWLAGMENLKIVTDNYMLMKLNKKSPFKVHVLNSLDIVETDSVYKILKKINAAVQSVKTENDSFLYEIGYHAEGSTAGYIHDLACFLKQMTPCVEWKDIQLLLCEESCYIESLALQSIAKSKKIEYRAVGTGKITYGNIKRKISRAAVLYQVREIYRILRSYLMYHDVKSSGTYEIGYLHTSDLPSRISRQGRSVDETGNMFRTCVICYNCDKAFEEFTEKNYKTDNLSAYLSLRKLLKAYICYLRDRKKLIRTVRKKLSIFLYGADLTESVLSLYISHLNSEILKNVLRYHMFDDYLKENSVLLVTGQGNSNFIEYRMFYHTLKKQKKKALFYRENRHIEAVNVSGWTSYEPYADMFDFLIFSPNNKVSVPSGWRGTCYLCGLDNRENIFDWQRNIEDGGRLSFLWAPSAPCRHSYSAARFIKDNRAVITQCGSQDCTLYVKFHPGTDAYLSRQCKKMCFHYDNVIFLEELEPIEGYIDQADIVLTTPSLVIFDAAKHGRMVICLTDDLKKVTPLEKGFLVMDSEQLDIESVMKHYSRKETAVVAEKQFEFMDSYYYTKTDLRLEDVLRMKIRKAKGIGTGKDY